MYDLLCHISFLFKLLLPANKYLYCFLLIKVVGVLVWDSISIFLLYLNLFQPTVAAEGKENL